MGQLCSGKRSSDRYLGRINQLLWLFLYHFPAQRKLWMPERAQPGENWNRFSRLPDINGGLLQIGLLPLSQREIHVGDILGHIVIVREDIRCKIPHPEGGALIHALYLALQHILNMLYTIVHIGLC